MDTPYKDTKTKVCHTPAGKMVAENVSQALLGVWAHARACTLIKMWANKSFRMAQLPRSKRHCQGNKPFLHRLLSYPPHTHFCLIRQHILTVTETMVTSEDGEMHPLLKEALHRREELIKHLYRLSNYFICSIYLRLIVGLWEWSKCRNVNTPR